MKQKRLQSLFSLLVVFSLFHILFKELNFKYPTEQQSPLTKFWWPREKDAFQKLSEDRLEKDKISQFPYPNDNDEIVGSNSDFRIAVLMQVGYERLPSDVITCAVNIIAAGARLDLPTVDFYVSVDAYNSPGDPNDVIGDLENIAGVGNVNAESTLSDRNDSLQFLKLLYHISTDIGKRSSYSVFLKLHSFSDPELRERVFESLCGTQDQVVSIINSFRKDGVLDILAPLGTFAGPGTNVSQNLFHLVNNHFNISKEHSELQKLRSVLLAQKQSDSLSQEDMAFVFGNMYWGRISSFLPRQISWSEKTINEIIGGYRTHLDVQDALRYYFISEIVRRRRKVAEIPPCPRVVAMYFPQFHPIPENDKFWGDGFTEWTLLKPLHVPGIRKPLPVDQGGLGYYNLLSKNVRSRQSDMARQAGINGFIYYHYWFSGEGAPAGHLVMHRVLEQMLVDGEPNIPFALSWANEPWINRWDAHNATGQSIIDQDYGDTDEWEEHFMYLLKFFRHPNYIRIHGEPMFIIYRIGHFGSKLKPMLDLWRSLAKEAGLPGIHFVNTIGNYRRSDTKTSEIERSSNLNRAFHFWPLYKRSGFPYKLMKTYTSSKGDFESLLNTYPIQYWGAFAGFDRRPRAPKAKPDIRSAKEFDMGLQCSFQKMTEFRDREVDKNLFFITAWNEWNEQAILEPDHDRKFSHLVSISNRLSAMPISLVFPQHELLSQKNSRGISSDRLCYPASSRGTQTGQTDLDMSQP